VVVVTRRSATAPTVKDVAALAGVSPMTVSRVVTGNPSVGVDLRERVLAAIAKLGYEPNRNASAMRNPEGVGGAVGLCVETIDNPFSAAVARGLELALRPSGFLLFTASSEGEAATERDVLLEFYRRRVAALVVMTVCTDHSFLVPTVHPRVPIVYVDRPALLPGCDHVTSDHREGARRCVAHLIDHGHRRIGFVGSNVTGLPIGERLAGYRAALTTAGLSCSDDLVIALPHSRTVAEARAATIAMLTSANPPTAIFAAANTDMLAVGQALHELQLAERVAHIAFDDIDTAELLTPPLSAYTQQPVELGRLCGEAIIRRVKETTASAAGTRVLTGALVARGSGEIPAPPRRRARRGPPNRTTAS
jgi:LacI family transcriptional regulator